MTLCGGEDSNLHESALKIDKFQDVVVCVIRRSLWRIAAIFHARFDDVPWYSAGLHAVGEGNVVGPDIELPLAKTKSSAVTSSAVYSHSHVQNIHACNAAHQSETDAHEITINAAAT